MESPTRMKKNQSEGFSSPKERYPRNPQKLFNTISTAGTDSPSRIAARNILFQHLFEATGYSRSNSTDINSKSTNKNQMEYKTLIVDHNDLTATHIGDRTVQIDNMSHESNISSSNDINSVNASPKLCSTFAVNNQNNTKENIENTFEAFEEKQEINVTQTIKCANNDKNLSQEDFKMKQPNAKQIRAKSLSSVVNKNTPNNKESMKLINNHSNTILTEKNIQSVDKKAPKLNKKDPIEKIKIKQSNTKDINSKSVEKIEQKENNTEILVSSSNNNSQLSNKNNPQKNNNSSRQKNKKSFANVTANKSFQNNDLEKKQTDPNHSIQSQQISNKNIRKYSIQSNRSIDVSKDTQNIGHCSNQILQTSQLLNNTVPLETSNVNILTRDKIYGEISLASNAPVTRSKMRDSLHLSQEIPNAVKNMRRRSISLILPKINHPTPKTPKMVSKGIMVNSDVTLRSPSISGKTTNLEASKYYFDAAVNTSFTKTDPITCETKSAAPVTKKFPNLTMYETSFSFNNEANDGKPADFIESKNLEIENTQSQPIDYDVNDLPNITCGFAKFDNFKDMNLTCGYALYEKNIGNLHENDCNKSTIISNTDFYMSPIALEPLESEIKDSGLKEESDGAVKDFSLDFSKHPVESIDKESHQKSIPKISTPAFTKNYTAPKLRVRRDFATEIYEKNKSIIEYPGRNLENLSGLRKRDNTAKNSGSSFIKRIPWKKELQSCKVEWSSSKKGTLKFKALQSLNCSQDHPSSFKDISFVVRYGKVAVYDMYGYRFEFKAGSGFSITSGTPYNIENLQRKTSTLSFTVHL